MTDNITKKTKYTLLEPVTNEGREVTELHFRRMKGKDIRDADRIDNRIDQTAHLMSALSGMPPEIFDEMDAADIDGVTKIIEGFMKRKAR